MTDHPGETEPLCTSCEGTGHREPPMPRGSCIRQPYSPILSCCHGCPVCGGTGAYIGSSGGSDV